jgi:hypothetical protein
MNLSRARRDRSGTRAGRKLVREVGRMSITRQLFVAAAVAGIAPVRLDIAAMEQ